jgi:GT2 family glycosyltransferase
MQKKHIKIVILNWNSYQDTIACLESVFRHNYDNYQVIVCDNDSKDESMKHLMLWADGQYNHQPDPSDSLNKLIYPAINKPVRFQYISREESENAKVENYNHCPLLFIQTGANLGFAGGNNVGIRFAMKDEQTDYIWLLNNDTVIEKDTLQNMLSYSQAQKEANICGSTIRFYNQPDTIQYLGGCKYNQWTGLASESLGRGLKITDNIDHKSYEKQLSYISGASWLLPRSFIEDIGLMCEDYFLYCEEIDWCVRNNNRYQLCYAPDAYVYHKEGNSIGSPNDERASSLFSDFYIFRNKLLFTRKYYPKAIFTAYLTTIFQAFNRLRRGQWDKALLIAKIILGKKNLEN